MAKGLLIVYTGNGKGKTTAAMGIALRALGHNYRVCIIQFLKGSWKSGEFFSAQRFNDLLDFHIKGKGFTWQSTDIGEDKKAARDAWEFAKSTIQSKRYHVIILDELTYLIQYALVHESEIVECLNRRSDNLHVVITGRKAPQTLIEEADIVTHMVDVKHPLRKGIKAQKGIDY